MLIIANNKCTANCSHCSFPKRPVKIYKNLQKIAATLDDYVILSGGEPLELDRQSIKMYIQSCKENKKFYRIATGGHIDILSVDPEIYRNDYFTGFSIGTDIILDRLNKSYRANYCIWKKNIFVLSKFIISYSLTITYKPKLQLEPLFNFKETLNPEFILINYLNGKWEPQYDSFDKRLKIKFPKIQFIAGYQDSSF